MADIKQNAAAFHEWRKTAPWHSKPGPVEAPGSYEGMACEKCGGTRRYWSDHTCYNCTEAWIAELAPSLVEAQAVHRGIVEDGRGILHGYVRSWGERSSRLCTVRREQAEAHKPVKPRLEWSLNVRAAALAAGAARYEGAPCKRCGGTLRFTRSYSCVACTRARDRVRDGIRRAAKVNHGDASPSPKSLKGAA
jgi:hypothetical protein